MGAGAPGCEGRFGRRRHRRAFTASARPGAEKSYQHYNHRTVETLMQNCSYLRAPYLRLHKRYHGTLAPRFAMTVLPLCLCGSPSTSSALITPTIVSAPTESSPSTRPTRTV